MEVLGGNQTSSLAGDKVTLSTRPRPHAGNSGVSVSGAQRYQVCATASPYCTYKSCYCIQSAKKKTKLWGNPLGMQTEQGFLRGEMPLQHSREVSLL